MREVEPHEDRACKIPLQRLNRRRDQLADASGGQVPGDAEHAQAVAAVGGDGNIDARIIETHQRCEGRADLSVVRQLDDAFMVVRNTHLTLGAEHAEARDSTDGTLLQHHVGAGNMCANGREDDFHAGARIGRAANHVQHFRARVDLAHTQAVGIGVLLRRLDIGDRERCELGRAVIYRLDFQA